MKVLLTHRPGGAYGYISDGWLNALIAAGHIAHRWDGSRKNWEDIDPDLYIGCSGHRQPIPADRGRALLAIHVNPYCDVELNGVNENQSAIDWVLAQRPTVIFGYGHEDDRHFWIKWTSKHGLPWVPLPTAGDSTIYYDRGLPRDIDLGYVGGYWPYKAKNIDKYLLPLIASHNLNVVVRGWGHWPLAIEPIDDVGVPMLLCRSKVGPCVTEPHTTNWGIDLPERLWKVALCGALVVHDPVVGLGRHMELAVMAHDPAAYARLCYYYAAAENEAERRELAAKQRAEVLANHTYFQRMATLFTALHRAGGAAEFGIDALKLTTLS